MKYRRPVVQKNLKNSFPNKPAKELAVIEKKFYRHFCDIIVESLKNFTISEKQVQKRMKNMTPDFFKQFSDKGQSVILCGGHYNNWELYAMACGGHAAHMMVGIYKPLRNKFFNSKMKNSRSKYGLNMIATKETSDWMLAHSEDLTSVIFAIDQSPGNPRKCYWTEFLGQETAVFWGPERYAKKLDRPVVWGAIKKRKRGYYELTYSLITDQATSLPEGGVLELLNKQLTSEIESEPQYWLWTHKRWKHKRPADL